MPDSNSPMNSKHFLSFIGGFLLTTLFYGLLAFAILFAGLSMAGETLDEKETKDALIFFFCFSVIIFTLYIIYRRLKTNRKFSAVGITIPLLFAFYILFVTGQVYFDNLNYHEKFDRNKWVKTESKPFKMAKTLVKDSVLIGQTRKQVIEMLGATPDTLQYEKNDNLQYSTDEDTWELILKFKGDKVVESYLYEEGVGV